jgi:hypothetical protein
VQLALDLLSERPIDWGLEAYARETFSDRNTIDTERQGAAALLRERRVLQCLGSATDKHFERSVRRTHADTGRGSVISVRAYAHDRIVVTPYPEPLPSDNRAKRWRRSKLDKCRETRRGCHRSKPDGVKVGGRLRTRPPSTKFTSKARNSIKDAAHVTEHFEAGTGWFVTFTFPGGTARSFGIASYCAGFIVDRMNRWLRYKVNSGLFCYVWELQERGAPHLHYLFRLDENPDLLSFYPAMKAQWRKILMQVTLQSGVDMFEREQGNLSWICRSLPKVDMRPITHTYASYISKYVSKVESKSGAATTWRPGRWCGMSAECRALVKSRRVTVKVVFRDESMAWKVAHELLQKVDKITLSLWKPPNPTAYNFGLASFTVAPKQAKGIGEALASWLVDGDLSALDTIISEHAAQLTDTDAQERNTS